MRFRKLDNDSAVVLIIVIIIIFLMSILCATIFSQSMSQTKTVRSQIDTIVAEEYAKGMFWKNYMSNYKPADASWKNFTSICPTPPDPDTKLIGCGLSFSDRSFYTLITTASSGVNVNVTY